MQTTQFTLQNIPETLLLPLFGRAEMTRSGNRILLDPFAVELIDRIDYDFTKIRADFNTSKVLTWIARARQLDDKIVEFIDNHPDAAIVNLGSGLDTTFQRVDNGRIQWFDIDLPEVVELRRKLLIPSEREHFVAASLFDNSWHKVVKKTGLPILFIAGGVFFYFTANENRDLFRMFAIEFKGAEIVFDAMNSKAIERVNRMMVNVGMEKALLQWGLDDTKELALWDAGFEVIERFSCFRGLDLRGLGWRPKLLALINSRVNAFTIVHGIWK